MASAYCTLRSPHCRRRSPRFDAIGFAYRCRSQPCRDRRYRLGKCLSHLLTHHLGATGLAVTQRPLGPVLRTTNDLQTPSVAMGRDQPVLRILPTTRSAADLAVHDCERLSRHHRSQVWDGPFGEYLWMLCVGSSHATDALRPVPTRGPQLDPRPGFLLNTVHREPTASPPSYDRTDSGGA